MPISNKCIVSKCMTEIKKMMDNNIKIVNEV